MSSHRAQSTSEWERLEGIPQLDDPFVQKYLDGRQDLIEEENSSRSDAAFRSSLSLMAREACEIVRRIRTEERTTLWQQSEGVERHIHPGMPFPLARDRLQGSKLWNIVSKMPKGALLHAHLEAMIESEWLLDQALTTKGMAFFADQPLTSSEALKRAEISFKYVGTAYDFKAASIWSSEYVPGTMILASEAASSFPDTSVSGFKQYLIQRMTISADESFDHYHGLDAIWSKFNGTFPIIGSILFYEPIFRCAIPRLLSELLEDGIRWVDLRCVFVSPFTQTHHTESDVDFHALLAAFGDELVSFQFAHPTFWGARIIWSTLRRLPKRAVIAHMKQCLDVKLAFPHLIAGYDLVGQEDAGRPLVALLPELLWLRKRCAELGLTLPFFFHAGECLGTGDATDHNLFDAVLLGARRLGHAFSLYKHPLLVDLVRTKHILVEACPISNEVLRLASSILHHPLPALLARGVKCALANDDPAILGHTVNGLTADFAQALQGWDSLGLAGLGSLAEESVRYAAYAPDLEAKAWIKEVRDGATSEGVRGERMREWRALWEDFCAWVVREYGADYGSEDDEEMQDEDEEDEGMEAEDDELDKEKGDEDDKQEKVAKDGEDAKKFEEKGKAV